MKMLPVAVKLRAVHKFTYFLRSLVKQGAGVFAAFLFLFNEKNLLCYSHSLFLSGNLTARHKEVFLRNPLFVGMRLPEVKEITPLEKKFPRISNFSLSFMKVSTNGQKMQCHKETPL